MMSIDSATNMIVIKTITGSAQAAAEAIDSLKWQEILGTIAGDNTILVIARSEEIVDSVVGRIQALIKR
jgi:transcriptional regulator of arginine metabolism